jgi:hypothetical protein
MKMGMVRSTYILVWALGASLALACGDDDDEVDNSPAAIRALCEEGCATALSLSCPNEETVTCARDCDYTEAISEACRPTARATLQCATDLPASAWACDAEGQAAIQSDVCDAQAQALLACLAGTEEGECPFENDKECDDPTGTGFCPAGTDLDDCAP